MEVIIKDRNPHDPLNMIGEAYELLLEKTMHNFHIIDGKDTPLDSKENLHIKNRSFDHKITAQDDKSSVNTELLKLSIVNAIRNTADRTTMDLIQLQSQKKLPNEFHAEELVNKGTLYCDHCGTPVELFIPSFLEKCHHCGYTTFRKLH